MSEDPPRREPAAGLLLAGGESRRFGPESKARHRVEGRSMAARVFGALRGALGRDPLVSVRPGTAPFAGLEEARYVEDGVPGAGPLAGLCAGLAATRAPWLLVAPCDLPFLTAEALRGLLRARATEADAVIACTPAGRRQPLCACYRRAAVRPIAERLLRDRQLAMHGLLDRFGARVRVVELPARALRNVNERTDLPDA